MTDLTKRTWAEIHLDRLAHNYRVIREKLGPETEYLALVKANAYGHGAVRCAQEYQKLGADRFAVACLDEAEELRHVGIVKPILILGYTAPEFTDRLISGEIIQTVYDEESARKFSEYAVAAGGVLSIHLKADTGMSRLGFLCDEAHMNESVEAMLRTAALPGLKVDGLFMHFSSADSYAEDSKAYSLKQIARFTKLRELLAERGLKPAVCHCAASAAIVNYPEVHFDMVRPGIIQYGYAPDDCMEGVLDLQPVMEVKSRIASVRSLPAGTCISYGRTYTLSRDSRIAVVPIGYADGLFRLLSGKQEMLVRGQRVKQIGRVCMDMCMLDVTDLPEVEPGDVVTLFGDGLPLQEKANAIGTITYELLCDISPRVPRVYMD